MNEMNGEFWYAPLHPELIPIENLKRQPLDLQTLTVTALVVICELDQPVKGSASPTMSMAITQFLKLLDGSLIRLDMDRGTTSFRHGHYAIPVSWKASLDDIVKNVIDIIKFDIANPDDFPWDEYAQAAHLRGITVDAQSLKQLPRKIMFSDELIKVYEF